MVIAVRHLIAACVAVSLIAVLGACEGAKRESSGWTTYENGRRGYTVGLPANWHRARGNLTAHITDPVEILSVATIRLPDGDQLCGKRGALARVPPAGALVTLQERGRGAYGSSGFPPRPARFRPDPKLPGNSTWPYCAAGEDEPPIPVLDYWFGFSDAGRAFHVLVAIGKEASAKVRDDAFRILDRLRFDPSVKPSWRSSG